MGAAGTGVVALEGDAGGEAVEGFLGRDPFDLGPVGAWVGAVWVEEAGIEAGFVAEEEEAFGIGVEAAERIDVPGEAEPGERAVRGTVRGELAEDPVGFVEGHEHVRGRQTISPRMRRTVTSWVTRVLAIMLSGRMPRQVELG